jgi:hypothetical protein
VYSDKINAPQIPLFNKTSLWQFVIWGIDLTGHINLKATNGYKFILLAIDYITK